MLRRWIAKFSNGTQGVSGPLSSDERAESAERAERAERVALRKRLREVELTARIANAFAWGRGTYGSPPVHVELQNSGEHVGAKRVARLMVQSGLRAAETRNFRKTTDSDHRIASC